MMDLCRLIFWTLIDLMRVRATLEAEIWVLRQQLNVLRRSSPKRQSFGTIDRLIFVGLYRLFPKACDALAIVKPDTIIRWHRAGFRSYWRWKSRSRGGRPTVPPEIRRLIREMSIANALCGAPRIHGELLKLGIDIGQSSVAKYMVKKTTATVARLEDIPSQSCGWDRCDGYVRGSNDLVPPSLWLVDPAAQSARDPVAWSYRTSDCGMDRQSTWRGLRLGTNSSISDPGSGWRLRRSLPPATSITGYSRSTNIAALTLAKTDTLNDSSAQSDGNVLITL